MESVNQNTLTFLSSLLYQGDFPFLNVNSDHRESERDNHISKDLQSLDLTDGRSFLDMGSSPSKRFEITI